MEEESMVQIFNHLKASELLGWKLRIPPYQRPYCWDEKNIRDFLGDLDLQQHSLNSFCCHIGSIILKQQKDLSYDVIDGQQRLTTLAIYRLVKQGESSELLNTKKKYTRQEKWTLHQALKLLENTLFDSEIDLSRIELSVVVLGINQPEDRAYTFFSNSNATGKRLSDYDLLKTHHLRYVSSDGAQEKYSANWHELEKSGVMDDVMHKMLFRLRKWNYSEFFSVDAASLESRDIFYHYKSVDTLKEFIGSCRQTPRFNSLLSGGAEFFNFVRYYSQKYSDFSTKRAIRLLEKYLHCHSSGVLCAGIKAITFLFFCKFGDMYLNEAVYLIALRLSELRNEPQVRDSYFNTKPIFSEMTRLLDQSTSDSQFFALLSDPKKRYKETNDGQRAQWYWEALHELLIKLSQGPFAFKRMHFVCEEGKENEK